VAQKPGDQEGLSPKGELLPGVKQPEEKAEVSVIGKAPKVPAAALPQAKEPAEKPEVSAPAGVPAPREATMVQVREPEEKPQIAVLKDIPLKKNLAVSPPPIPKAPVPPIPPRASQREPAAPPPVPSEEYTLVSSETRPPEVQPQQIPAEDVLLSQVPRPSPAPEPEEIVPSFALIEALPREPVNLEIREADLIPPIPPEGGSVPGLSSPEKSLNFSNRMIRSLEKGKYYLQLAALSRVELVEAELSRLGPSWPLAVQTVRSEGRLLYRILIGPVNRGESAALLQRFKTSGYRDAFVRTN
jgi:hypothetical protein